MTDREVVDRLRLGDENALGLLIDRYAAYVAAVVASPGSLSREDVEELSSDVFVSAWKNRLSIRAETLKPYLAQIARNAAIDCLRKRKGTPVPFDDEILPQGSGDQPDELAVRREQADILNEAVGSFAEPEREIFVRFYWLGEPIARIAKRLRMPPATVKTKLRRSRGKLRDRFEERGYRYEG